LAISWLREPIQTDPVDFWQLIVAKPGHQPVFEHVLAGPTAPPLGCAVGADAGEAGNGRCVSAVFELLLARAAQGPLDALGENAYVT